MSLEEGQSRTIVEVGPTIVVAVTLILGSMVGVDVVDDNNDGPMLAVKDKDDDAAAAAAADDDGDVNDDRRALTPSGWDVSAVFALLPLFEEAEARAPPTPPPTAAITTTTATTTNIQNLLLRRPQMVSCCPKSGSSLLYGYLCVSISEST